LQDANYWEVLQLIKNGQSIAILQIAIYKNGQIIAILQITIYENGQSIAILQIIKIRFNIQVLNFKYTCMPAIGTSTVDGQNQLFPRRTCR
jgi:hypothetical protein